METISIKLVKNVYQGEEGYCFQQTHKNQEGETVSKPITGLFRVTVRKGKKEVYTTRIKQVYACGSKCASLYELY